MFNRVYKVQAEVKWHGDDYSTVMELDNEFATEAEAVAWCEDTKRMTSSECEFNYIVLWA